LNIFATGWRHGTCSDAELALLLLLLLLLQEYFSRIMKKLKEVGATADRTNFYV
jgi:hypothetical protein